MILHEIGLMNLWIKWFEPEMRPCVVDQQTLELTNRNKKLNVQLTLSNMTGVFAILIGGYLLATLAFVAEFMVSLVSTSRNREQRRVIKPC